MKGKKILVHVSSWNDVHTYIKKMFQKYELIILCVKMLYILFPHTKKVTRAKDENLKQPFQRIFGVGTGNTILFTLLM